MRLDIIVVYMCIISVLISLFVYIGTVTIWFHLYSITAAYLLMSTNVIIGTFSLNTSFMNHQSRKLKVPLTNTSFGLMEVFFFVKKPGLNLEL